MPEPICPVLRITTVTVPSKRMLSCPLLASLPVREAPGLGAQNGGHYVLSPDNLSCQAVPVTRVVQADSLSELAVFPACLPLHHAP